MSEQNKWTLESMDISAIERAPNITFEMSEDRREISAEPPGGRIRITAIDADGVLSRIVLTNAITDEVFADIESRLVEAPSVGDDWNIATNHASEIAASLYWSMWRMQQLRGGA